MSVPDHSPLYIGDFLRRTSPAPGRRDVHLAAHLTGSPLLAHAEPLIVAMKTGGNIASHLSPMKSRKRAFKKACQKGDWTTYRKQMDELLNKWGFFHFHCNGGKQMVFVFFDDRAAAAYVIDVVEHDGNWALEQRLVEIVVANWPEAGIAHRSCAGTSDVTENDLFLARSKGLNMPVAVSGAFYYPASGGLMSDRSSYSVARRSPTLVITGSRFDPNAKDAPPVISDPRFMVVAVDPSDPRPHWEVAAEQAGILSG